MYKNCKNERSPGKHIYRFPLQTDARHYLWIRNSGKFMYIFNIHKSGLKNSKT